jgi:hypothetical protein
MHRDMTLTIPAAHTAALVEAITSLEAVVTVAVRRGESVKPPGDVVKLTVLNHGVDEVVRQVQQIVPEGSLSVSMSEVSSLFDRDGMEAIRADVDEASWEDTETALRRHTRPTTNFFAANATAGVIAGAGLLSTSLITQASALIGAAVIAVVFEPLVA